MRERLICRKQFKYADLVLDVCFYYTWEVSKEEPLYPLGPIETIKII